MFIERKWTSFPCRKKGREITRQCQKDGWSRNWHRNYEGIHVDRDDKDQRALVNHFLDKRLHDKANIHESVKNYEPDLNDRLSEQLTPYLNDR